MDYDFRSKHPLKNFVRELLPHAAWTGIEWLVRLAEASLIAGAFATYQWFRASLTITPIAIIFVSAFACLGFTALGGIIFGRLGDSVQRHFGHEYPPPAGITPY